MIREIVKNEEFLAKVSEKSTLADVNVGVDLLDTLEANKEGCVGLAANMIGELKRIIVVDDEGKPILMFNPEIIKFSDEYETEEGCLSLEGVRTCKRYNKIKVEYCNKRMEKKVKSFSGFTAEIIQHEIDHCNGIII